MYIRIKFGQEIFLFIEVRVSYPVDVAIGGRQMYRDFRVEAPGLPAPAPAPAHWLHPTILLAVSPLHDIHVKLVKR